MPNFFYCVKCKSKTESVNVKTEKTKSSRLINKGICVICGSKTSCFGKNSEKVGGDVVGFIEKTINPPEMHLPGHNFTGPFTRLVERIKRGDNPVNRVDAAAMKHDITYYENEDTSKRHTADEELLDDLDDIENPTFREKLERKLVRFFIKKKLRWGLGIGVIGDGLNDLQIF